MCYVNTSLSDMQIQYFETTLYYCTHKLVSRLLFMCAFPHGLQCLVDNESSKHMDPTWQIHCNSVEIKMIVDTSLNPCSSLAQVWLV